MRKVRKSQERFFTDAGWLISYHTFSFGEHNDPNHMGFSDLRVINEDIVQPSRGFATHSHRDMEILTYILEGSLAHKDSLGTGGTIRPGDVQRMSAGTGVAHSEVNPSNTDAVHLLQIWILPDNHGEKPSYEQRFFPIEERSNVLRLIGSPDGAMGSVTIFQDVKLYASMLSANKELSWENKADRKVWIQVARGALQIEQDTLNSGDGMAVSGADLLVMKAKQLTEFLLFDLEL